MYINTIKISNLFYSPTNLTIYAFEYSNHNLFNYSLYSIELNPNAYNSYIAFVFIFDNIRRDTIIIQHVTLGKSKIISQMFV